MESIADRSPAATIPTPFPARTMTASALVGDIQTAVTRISFSDKILVTISQAGRLNHWVHVPLLNAAPSESGLANSQPYDEPESDQPDSSLLPYSHLTATTILGGTKPEFEVLGQTLATTVASAILMRQPEEQRMLVLGVGLDNADMGTDGFEGMIGLCLDVL